MNAILGIAAGRFRRGHDAPQSAQDIQRSAHGSPGGPITVADKFARIADAIVERQGSRVLAHDRPPISRVRSFFSNVILVRAYCYLRTHGPDGLQAVSENAVLNANYLLSRVKHILPVPKGERCLHEFVATAAPLKKKNGASAMDLAKRLLDFGFHAPTVYFPLTVPEAMMIEPTETESKETLDAFAETLFRITEESRSCCIAPHSTLISRPDEVRAPVNRCCGGRRRRPSAV
jgi:glycine dehydrogenase subunit 2